MARELSFEEQQLINNSVSMTKEKWLALDDNARYVYLRCGLNSRADQILNYYAKLLDKDIKPIG